MKVIFLNVALAVFFFSETLLCQLGDIVINQWTYTASQPTNTAVQLVLLNTTTSYILNNYHLRLLATFPNVQEYILGLPNITLGPNNTVFETTFPELMGQDAGALALLANTAPLGAISDGSDYVDFVYWATVGTVDNYLIREAVTAQVWSSINSPISGIALGTNQSFMWRGTTALGNERSSSADFTFGATNFTTTTAPQFPQTTTQTFGTAVQEGESQCERYGTGVTFNFGSYTVCTISIQGPFCQDLTFDGTSIHNLQDDDDTQINLPFSFQFFADSYNSFRLSSNGYIDFSADSARLNQNECPLRTNNLPAPIFAMFWDDLNPSQNQVTSHTGQSPDGNQIWAARFTNVSRFAAPQERVTFIAGLESNTNTAFVCIFEGMGDATIGLRDENEDPAQPGLCEEDQDFAGTALLFINEASPRSPSGSSGAELSVAALVWIILIGTGLLIGLIVGACYLYNRNKHRLAFGLDLDFVGETKQDKQKETQGEQMKEFTKEQMESEEGPPISSQTPNPYLPHSEGPNLDFPDDEMMQPRYDQPTY